MATASRLATSSPTRARPCGPLRHQAGHCHGQPFRLRRRRAMGQRARHRRHHRAVVGHVGAARLPGRAAAQFRADVSRPGGWHLRLRRHRPRAAAPGARGARPVHRPVDAGGELHFHRRRLARNTNSPGRCEVRSATGIRSTLRTACIRRDQQAMGAISGSRSRRKATPSSRRWRMFSAWATCANGARGRAASPMKRKWIGASLRARLCTTSKALHDKQELGAALANGAFRLRPCWTRPRSSATRRCGSGDTWFR